LTNIYSQSKIEKSLMEIFLRTLGAGWNSRPAVKAREPSINVEGWSGGIPEPTVIVRMGESTID